MTISAYPSLPNSELLELFELDRLLFFPELGDKFVGLSLTAMRISPSNVGI